MAVASWGASRLLVRCGPSSGYGTVYTDSLIGLRPWGSGALNAPARPRLLFQRAHPLLKGAKAPSDLY